MKKVLLVAAVAGMAMVSCKKDYTCECTGAAIPSGVSAKIEYKKVKKKDAKESCDAVNTTYQVYGTGISCSLK